MLDVIGHSMEPMIRHKDTILVDQSVKELPGRGPLPRGFGEELLVKRVQRTPRGWLLSRKTAISPTSWSKARISKPSVSTGGYAGSGGSSEGCPSS